MAAVQLEEPDLALGVAEEDQVLAHDANGLRQILQLRGEANRLPEAAQILAAGCPRPDPGQLGIVLRDVPMMIGAVGSYRGPRLGRRHVTLLEIGRSRLLDVPRLGVP